MKLHGAGLTWDVVYWPGRNHVRICCVRALLHDDEQNRAWLALRPCPHVDCPGRPTATVVDEPDVYVRVMREHDLGDCDERYLRIR